MPNILNAKSGQQTSSTPAQIGHNGQHPYELVPIASLKIDEDDPRKLNRIQKKTAAKIVVKMGQQLPVIVDVDNRVIVGHALVIGAI